MKTIPILRCPGPDHPAELVVAGVVFEVSDRGLLNLVQKASEILLSRPDAKRELISPGSVQATASTSSPPGDGSAWGEQRSRSI